MTSKKPGHLGEALNLGEEVSNNFVWAGGHKERCHKPVVGTQGRQLPAAPCISEAFSGGSNRVKHVSGSTPKKEFGLPIHLAGRITFAQDLISSLLVCLLRFSEAYRSLALKPGAWRDVGHQKQTLNTSEASLHRKSVNFC